MKSKNRVLDETGVHSGLWLEAGKKQKRQRGRKEQKKTGCSEGFQKRLQSRPRATTKRAGGGSKRKKVDRNPTGEKTIIPEGSEKGGAHKQGAQRGGPCNRSQRQENFFSWKSSSGSLTARKYSAARKRGEWQIFQKARYTKSTPKP